MLLVKNFELFFVLLYLKNLILRSLNFFFNKNMEPFLNTHKNIQNSKHISDWLFS